MTVPNSTEYVSSFEMTWKQLEKLDQKLDMEAFLDSELFADQRKFYMQEFISNTVSGLISLIASILLAIHILRSHHGLSTTYHRLVFGLSCSDILSSLAYALSSLVVPKEMDYLVPFAYGNLEACDVQGTLIHFGLLSGCLYNCCICVYYLAIITYNKKDNYIRSKLEPWFHGITLSIPLVSCIALSTRHAYNGPNGGFCSVRPYEPPHCLGYEEGYIPDGFGIPCGRGSKTNLVNFFEYARLVIIYFPLVVIILSMLMMYRTVSTIEKRMQNYGVSALRVRVVSAPLANNTQKQEESRFSLSKLYELLKRYYQNLSVAICQRASANQTKSNTVRSQKRAVLHMAFGYAMAWLIVYGPYCFLRTKDSKEVLFLWLSVMPLQGCFTFLVFMAPKVRTTRKIAMMRRNEHITWFQAFSRAYMDRGPQRRSELTTVARSRFGDRRMFTGAEEARRVRKPNQLIRKMVKGLKSMTTRKGTLTESQDSGLGNIVNVGEESKDLSDGEIDHVENGLQPAGGE